MATIYDAALGPLKFPTIFADLAEEIGDSIDTVGAALVVGEPKPRPFSLSLPVRGSAGEPNVNPNLVSNPSFEDGTVLQNGVVMNLSGSVGSNLIPNPNFKNDASSWAGISTGDVPSRITTDGVRATDTSCGRIVTDASAVGEGAQIDNIAVAASTAYTFSIYVKSSGAGGELVNLLLREKNGGTTVGDTFSSNLTLTTGWQRLTVTRTLGATATNVLIAARSASGSAVALDIRIGCAMLHVGTAAMNYADGDSFGWGWSGTAGNSTSTATTAIAASRTAARDGGWGAHFGITRSDGSSTVVRTPSGTSGMAIQPNTTYGARVSGYFTQPIAVGQVARCRIYWYKADGSAASTTVTDGTAVSNPTLSQWYDMAVVGTSPADAAFAAVALLFTQPSPLIPYYVEGYVDSYMLTQVAAGTTEATLAAFYVGIQSSAFAVGERLRRQLRALLGNRQARVEGLWFTFAQDPDIGGLLLVGGGKLSYAEDGGPGFGEYALELEDCYQIANARTHRFARRLSAYDLTTGLSPRDVRRRVYSADFNMLTPLAQHSFPGGATDVISGSKGSLIGLSAPSTVAGVDARGTRAAVGTAAGLTHGDTLHFELPLGADPRSGEVKIWDRRGSFTEGAATADPSSWGWERVLGTDQPSQDTANVFVIENGLVRVKPDPGAQVFKIEGYDSSTSTWVDRGKISVWFNGLSMYSSMSATWVERWTPDSGIIGVRLPSATIPVTLYITVKSGWKRAKFEIYQDAVNDAILSGPELLYSPPTSNPQGQARFDALSAAGCAIVLSDDPSQAWDLTPAAPTQMTTLGSVVLAQWDETTKQGVALVPGRGNECMGRLTESTTYGTSRKGTLSQNLDFGSGASKPDGWSALTVGLLDTGISLPDVFEAETKAVAGASRSTVSDAAGFGGTVLQETQTSSANSISYGSTPHPADGRVVGLFARVRASAAGSNFSIAGGFAAAQTLTKTFSANTYAWIYLGETSKALAGDALTLNVWRTSGTANALVDRVALLPLGYSNSTTTTRFSYTGIRDYARLAVMECAQVQDMIPR